MNPSAAIPAQTAVGPDQWQEEYTVWLDKKQPRFPYAWQRRYFLLRSSLSDGCQLLYFATPPSTPNVEVITARGALDLSQVQLLEQAEAEPSKAIFILQAPYIGRKPARGIKQLRLRAASSVACEHAIGNIREIVLKGIRTTRPSIVTWKLSEVASWFALFGVTPATCPAVRHINGEMLRSLSSRSFTAWGMALPKVLQQHILCELQAYPARTTLTPGEALANTEPYECPSGEVPCDARVPDVLAPPKNPKAHPPSAISAAHDPEQPLSPALSNPTDDYRGVNRTPPCCPQSAATENTCLPPLTVHGTDDAADWDADSPCTMEAIRLAVDAELADAVPPRLLLGPSPECSPEPKPEPELEGNLAPRGGAPSQGLKAKLLELEELVGSISPRSRPTTEDRPRGGGARKLHGRPMVGSGLPGHTVSTAPLEEAPLQGCRPAVNSVDGCSGVTIESPATANRCAGAAVRAHTYAGAGRSGRSIRRDGSAASCETVWAEVGWTKVSTLEEVAAALATWERLGRRSESIAFIRGVLEQWHRGGRGEGGTFGASCTRFLLALMSFMIGSTLKGAEELDQCIKSLRRAEHEEQADTARFIAEGSRMLRALDQLRFAVVGRARVGKGMGMVVATAAADGSMRIWDLSMEGDDCHGRLASRLGMTTKQVQSAVEVRTWGRFLRWSEHQALNMGSGAAPLEYAALQGRSCAVLSSDGSPVWINRNLHTFALGFSVRCCTFSPDGMLLAIGGTAAATPCLRVFDTYTWAEERTVHLVIWPEAAPASLASGNELATPAAVTRCRFDPAGMTLVAAVNDGQLVAWSSGSWGEVGQTALRNAIHDGAITCFAFCPDGHLLVIFSQGGTMQVLDTRMWAPLQALPGPPGPAFVTCCEFSPDGARLVAGSSQGRIYIWDVAGRALRVLDTEGSALTSCVFSPCGKKLVSGHTAGVLQIWEIHGSNGAACQAGADDNADCQLRKVKTLTCVDKECPLGDVASCSFTADGSHVVACAVSGACSEAAGGAPVTGAEQRSIAAEGTRVTIKVWDARTWIEVRQHLPLEELQSGLAAVYGA
ncbi:hypothetical protein CYMTET_11810 [Cymbomonas tetramitiformis]|uniref:PH domain-containing protein n=1 Tax=Cymbomonas tetramitiformis TaxID=36881 RepID=A0AAE0GLL6_9CHLO|nr:hypothetical protein CYMTET_11810 [Cymbomonas tetramitiformis]